ncbi:MAG: hypothetical protein ACREUE_17145 [Panacagrimonas sp.]
MDRMTDVTQLRAELALMSLYRNLGVPAEISLPLEVIGQHWPDYGIRASDLPGAIYRLVQKGFLSRRHGAPELIARTVAGEDWFDDQPAWLEYHLLQPRVSRAQFVRRIAPRKPMARRRRGDAPRARLGTD